jgi:nucleotide-binding universal stress UspA family protein
VFDRIIVTLDGSASSEGALGAATELARRLGSFIVLLHVIESRPPKAIHGERHLATAPEAEAYLEPIERRLEAEGLKASFHVHDSSAAGRAAGEKGVAASVAAHEAEFGNDLAVMAAHGRRGLADALSGSLPLKVAAAGGAAVLLVPPAGSRAEGALAAAFAPRRIVLPLDGRPEHEAAIPGASALAKVFGASILLVAAVPRSAAQAGGPGASFALLAPALSGASIDYAVEGSEAYLAGVQAKLVSEGIAAERLVVRGRPAKAIVAVCEEGDLLALSTHRRLGLDASLDGCVAFEAARRWRGAMLVAPVAREKN